MTRESTTVLEIPAAPPGGSRPKTHNGATAAVTQSPGQRRLDDFLRKIKSREARVGVIGLGYVGLPLVRVFTEKGYSVMGFDIDPSKVEQLNGGRSYIKSVTSDFISRQVEACRFLATRDFRRLGVVDAVIICVPTPLTPEGKPDVSFIRATAKDIAAHLRSGQLVVLESTSYPGTTREIMKAELEKEGMRCGEDFFLAFSPEREDPGNKNFTTEQIPKVVGGIDEPSLRAAAALYGAVISRVVEVSSCEAAEAAKLLENIYRCVNIALVNELKMCFDRMGIDVWEVIAAAATKPFGFQAFYPGPGQGGHCIPIDPFYLSWKAREFQFNTRFIDLAGELNIQMPYYVVGKLEGALRQRRKDLADANILMLGLAYKKDIDDPRESPAFKLMELLEGKGANVVYHDPHIPALPKMRHYSHLKAQPALLDAKVLSTKDAVLIVTDHSDYDYDWIVEHAPLVVDARNACRHVMQGREKIVRA